MLVVDLDGTLIRSDMLAECLFAGLARAPAATVGAVVGARGRAALKARLAAVARPDIARLPLREAVLARIEQARAAGRRIALVSAADASLVAAVAHRLGLFDEAHGSDGRRNLKGPAKAAFLVERYGRGGFDYIGDSRADLAVWAAARRAISAGADAGLRAELSALRPDAEHLDPAPGPATRLRPYLRAMRLHQWLKNALVLLPALASHATEPGIWAAALVGAIAFSLVASSVYLLNDLVDLDADRAHPRKCRRPFASGAAGLLPGAALAAALLGLAGLLAAVALPAGFVLVLVIYYALTLAYSLWLKRLLVIDILTLAGLFTLRVVAGAAATGIVLSPWMLAFSGFLFLSLAAMKRQTELVDGLRAGRERAAGRAYAVDDLPVVTMMAIAAGYSAVLVFALYVSSPAVQALYAAPSVLWGACPILLAWISRLVMLAHRGLMDDDPVVFAVRDPFSLTCGAGVLALAVAATLA